MNSFNVKDYPLLRVANGQELLGNMISFLEGEPIPEEEATMTLHSIDIQWQHLIRTCVPEIFSNKLAAAVSVADVAELFDYGTIPCRQSTSDKRVILLPNGSAVLFMADLLTRWSSITVLKNQYIILRAFREDRHTKGWIADSLRKQGMSVNEPVQIILKYITAILRTNPEPYIVHPGKPCIIMGEQYTNETQRILNTYDATAVELSYS